jgi:homoserine dehydrogenase
MPIWKLRKERIPVVKRIMVVHIGAGTVGGAAIEQELAFRDRWRRTHGVDIVIGAVIGIRGAVAATSPDGLPIGLLSAILANRPSASAVANAARELGHDLVDPQAAIDRVAAFGPVIALDAAVGDTTAACDVAVLQAGGGVVLSNKAPMAMPAGSIGDQLWAETGPGGRVRYEATVGAGLPVLSTLRTLLDTGDEVMEMTGTVSGTFGAIFSDVAAGQPFSAAVRNAKENGYTEPDPRDDLSGLDVARKALILARTIGRQVNLDEIAIESLVPEELSGVSISEFLDRVTMLDEPIAARSAEASRDGSVLKYVASVAADGPISVGIAPVSRSTVLGALQGPENIVSIRTSRYSTYPLTVTGPGAGAAVTAAGMTGDLLALATQQTTV